MSFKLQMKTEEPRKSSNWNLPKFYQIPWISLSQKNSENSHFNETCPYTCLKPAIFPVCMCWWAEAKEKKNSIAQSWMLFRSVVQCAQHKSVSHLLVDAHQIEFSSSRFRVHIRHCCVCIGAHSNPNVYSVLKIVENDRSYQLSRLHQPMRTCDARFDSFLIG